MIQSRASMGAAGLLVILFTVAAFIFAIIFAVSYI